MPIRHVSPGESVSAERTRERKNPRKETDEITYPTLSLHDLSASSSKLTGSLPFLRSVNIVTSLRKHVTLAGRETAREIERERERERERE